MTIALLEVGDVVALGYDSKNSGTNVLALAILHFN